MGNKVMSHPRIVLTGTMMSHFKASNLARDVVPIIHEWQKAGAELCLSREDFQRTFDVVVDSDAQFECFDSNKMGKVDAYEVLVVYILLSTGEKSLKLSTAFDVFSYSNGTHQGPCPSINFDEAMIMLSACVRGVFKVCLDAIQIRDQEVLFLCQSMFDMHRLSYRSQINQRQFMQWAMEDPSPNSFVHLFHTALEISDIRSEVQRLNLQQAAIFQGIAEIQSDGELKVRPDTLLNNTEFQRSLQDASEEDVTTIVELMTKHDDLISSERYHQVLRPWNIFNECDFDGSHNLDEKELDVLLWFQLRTRQTPEFVRRFLEVLDVDHDGEVSRLEWVEAALGEMSGPAGGGGGQELDSSLSPRAMGALKERQGLLAMMTA